METPQEFNPLALENQMCFALYVCSKEIIRKYTPILEPLGLTYTSYITFLALWEKDNISVKELGKKIFLDSGTLTPLLKKLESQGFISRIRSKEDERTVFVKLTESGKELRKKCESVPSQMMCYNFMEIEKATTMLQDLHTLMNRITAINNEK